MGPKHTIAFYGLFVLILIILVTILFNTCGNPTTYLNKALRDLDSAQHRLDTALVKIDDSKKIIDSMRLDLLNFQIQVNKIRSGVDQLKINNIHSDELFNHQ